MEHHNNIAPDWRTIIPLIENNRSFVLTSHINPDCDALGSELALAEFLQALNKQVVIINSDSAPTAYRFLDPKRRLKRYSAKKHATVINQADVIVVLDASGGWNRLGPVGRALEKAEAVKICIDHHPDSSDFVDAAVVDTNAAATGELIYNLIQTMGGVISKDMAQALYAAILTDTGSFRFPKTRPFTHQVIIGLLEAGANPLHIYSQIYEQNSLGMIRLKGHVMESIKTIRDGQVAYYELSRETLKYYNVKPEELDGFASMGQQIGSVRISLFCMEAASRGRIKISLRSDGSIPINQIAQAYGGGGHVSAAGALVDGTLSDVMESVLKKIGALFEAPASP